MANQTEYLKSQIKWVHKHDINKNIYAAKQAAFILISRQYT
jgi:hypothetical protein